MYIKRGLNKKGQEGVSMSGVTVAIILIVALAVVILVGYYFFYSEGSSLVNTLKPADLEPKVQSCLIYARAGTSLSFSFCNDFDEIKVSGNPQYISCQHPQVLEALQTVKNAESGFDIPTCPSGREATKCEELKQNDPSNYRGDILVNRRTCGYWINLALEQQEAQNGTNGTTINNIALVTSYNSQSKIHTVTAKVEPAIATQLSVATINGDREAFDISTNAQGTASFQIGYADPTQTIAVTVTATNGGASRSLPPLPAVAVA